jgi:hypothetical protein
MNPLLQKVRNIYQEGCVTITLNTHRTRPDNEKDPINLKNLVKEAEKRLYNDYEKRFVWPIMENLNHLVEKIDHSHNLESLVIFANGDFADYTTLPVATEDRVVIDNTFATRVLIRALHQESAYYVLVLSRQKARLIEAFNDKVTEEKSGPFPLENKLYATDKEKLSTNKGQDNLIEEFFNRVDKILSETTKDNPLPFFLATETRNYHHYLKVADKRDMIIGHINQNRDADKAHSIVSEVWSEMSLLIKKRNKERLDELFKAVSSNKFLSDYNEMWTAINHGRGKTLFVKKGFFQPALLVNDEIILVDNHLKEQKGIIDDIIDEMIELNLQYGGDTVFIEGDGIKEFGNVALITRY